MTLTKRCAAALAALALSAGAAAAPREVAGVGLGDPVELAGSRLALNGAGVRHKAVFKVYVAALYLEKKAATPEEVFALAGAKRIGITLLREIDSNELGKGFTKAFEDNAARADMPRLIPGLLRMGQVFAAQKKMAAGEGFTIDWVPGTGTVISVRGAVQGEPIREVEFFNAMLRIWLGDRPADWQLKDALLGRPAP